MIVGWLLIRMNFIYFFFEITQKLDVHALQRQDLLSDQTFLYLLYVMQQSDNVSTILWGGAHLVTCGLSGIFLKIWSEPSVFEVNILWCIAFWDVLHKMCPIWGYCDFPCEWNCGNSSSNTTWNWSQKWRITRFIIRATDPVWNGEWTRYIPTYERGYHLCRPAILPWKLLSKT